MGKAFQEMGKCLLLVQPHQYTLKGTDTMNFSAASTPHPPIISTAKGISIGCTFPLFIHKYRAEPRIAAALARVRSHSGERIVKSNGAGFAHFQIGRERSAGRTVAEVRDEGGNFTTRG